MWSPVRPSSKNHLVSVMAILLTITRTQMSIMHAQIKKQRYLLYVFYIIYRLLVLALMILQSLPPKTNSWTMAENVYVLELVELKVWDLNRTLNKTDFEEIARGMEKKFGGHIVGVGQKLATAPGKQEMFAQSSWYYPSRNSNSLHSYVTRKGGVWEHKYIQILNHYLH